MSSLTPAAPPTVPAGSGLVNATALDGVLASIVNNLNAVIKAMGVMREGRGRFQAGSVDLRQLSAECLEQIKEHLALLVSVRDQIAENYDSRMVNPAQTGATRVWSEHPTPMFRQPAMPSYPIFYTPITLAGVQGIPYLTRLRMRSFARWAMLDPGQSGVSAHAPTRLAFGLSQVPSAYGPEVVGVEVQGGLGVLVNVRKAIPTILTIDTALPGVSAANQFRLPLAAIGEFQFLVDWGDGQIDYITAWNDAATLHTFTNPGMQTITITGSLLGLRFAGGVNDREKLIDIQQWGNSVRFLPGSNDFGSGLFSDFRGCTSLTTLSATDGPTFEEDGSAIWLFALCSQFDMDVSAWDVSKLGDFSSMFAATPFNNAGSPGINDWDTSSAWNISFTFSSAASFNQPVEGWDVSGVQYLNGTFQNATAFNQPLAGWDVSACEQMQLMFRSARAFNQPLGAWNVENVTHMGKMFQGATAFQQDLGAWWPRSCVNMEFMFDFCTLTTPNYDALLVGWTGWSAGAPGVKGLALQNGVTFDAGDSQYSLYGDAAAARAWLIATKGWTITDGGGV